MSDDIVNLLHAQLLACGCTQTSSRPSGQMVPWGCVRCNAEEAARDEIVRLRAAGDALVAAIRNHDLTEQTVQAWEEARRDA